VLIKRFEEVSKETDTLDIIKAMEKIGPLVKSIAMLKKQAQLEQIGESRVRGGVEVDVFNTPKSSFIHK
jgi:hypothetical protein